MYLSAAPPVKSVAQRRGHVRELLDETHGDRDGPEPVVLVEADEGDKLVVISECLANRGHPTYRRRDQGRRFLGQDLLSAPVPP